MDGQITKLLVIEQGSELRDILSTEAALELVIETGPVADAPALAKRLNVNAVLLDLDFTGEAEGIQAALRFRHMSPEVAVVMVSENPSLEAMRFLPTSYEYGFRTGWSYLLRRRPMDRDLLIRALHISRAGWTLLDAGVMARLHPRVLEAVASLTPRLRGMLELADQGLSNQEIKERLYINTSNVELSFYLIFRRLAEFADPERSVND